MGNAEQRAADKERCCGQENPDWPVTVYKIGGSLFDWPELFPRLKEFFAAERSRPVIISGGGAMADVVRTWDRVHDLGAEQSHELAIASLSVGSRFLASGLSGVVVQSRSEAEAAWREHRIAVLDVAPFLVAENTDGAGAESLPATWDVTSDSIAAWIATRWPAQLVLIKSTAFPKATSAYVDPCFANASAGLRAVEWVDLRNGERDGLPRSQTIGSSKFTKAQHVA